MSGAGSGRDKRMDMLQTTTAIDLEGWYQAIFQRHSRRQYNGHRLTPQEKEVLIRACADLAFPDADPPATHAVFVDEPPEDVFRGAVGAYGKVTDAPAYLAFIADESDPNCQEKAGYLGECLVLEAVSKGLDTCWVGGYFRPEKVARQLRLVGRERVVAVTPVGHATPETTFAERSLSGLARSHHRLPLTALLDRKSPGMAPLGAIPVSHRGETALASLPPWALVAVEAARLAPSAVNRQPWRFAVEPFALTVRCRMPFPSFGISPRLDCGIAMAHLELGAAHAGARGRWEFLPYPGIARFTISA